MDIDFIKWLERNHNFEISAVHLEPEPDWYFINFELQNSYSAEELYYLSQQYDNGN